MYADLSNCRDSKGGTGMTFDLIIAWIGGQGTILLSNIIGEACVIEGRSIRGAETHGMAQRGGSIECQVRIDQEYGCQIAPGNADLMISFDLLEAARFAHYMKQHGTVVTNNEYTLPTSVFMQGFPDPGSEVLLSAFDTQSVFSINARTLAEQAGTVLTQNVVLLGAASRFIPLNEDSLREGISRRVPEKSKEMNLSAFDLGREAAAK
jgi:indolepyruvate ferredoxin oxidoreductase beta subunit